MRYGNGLPTFRCPQNLRGAAESSQRPVLRQATATDDAEAEVTGISGRTDSSEMSSAQMALERALREKAEMGKGTSDLLSNNMHRAWVAAGSSGIVGMLVKAGLSAENGADVATLILAATAAYFLSDLGTGIYHWGVDNYGTAKTPIFGSQIDAFQGHHQRPWTITKREFANNLHALARPTFFVLVPFLLAPSNPGLDAFVGVFMAGVMLSQQFHAWSHTPKTLLPAPVVALQDAGLLVGRKMHGAHHKPPYTVNYCIVSGLCNKPLDASGLIPWMESEILKRWGVAPRSWGETAPGWLEEVGYYENGQNNMEV